MINIVCLCDECGKPATYHAFGMTGRVLIDGIDNNLQSCDLCDDHKPREDSGFPTRPHNCKRVVFYWPEIDDKEQLT